MNFQSIQVSRYLDADEHGRTRTRIICLRSSAFVRVQFICRYSLTKTHTRSTLWHHQSKQPVEHLMRTIRWGIIGCGDVTEVKSGPGFQQASNSQLVAVMRRNGDLAKDYAQRHS